MAKLRRRLIMFFSGSGSSASGSTPGGGDASLEFNLASNSQYIGQVV